MPGSSDTPASDLQEILENLYRRRFSPSDLQAMQSVWKVLVGQFFQGRIDPAGTVVDVGAGACLFINAVRAERRIALDANPDVARHAAPGVETIVSSSNDLLEVPEEVADCVFLSNVLEHLDDYTAVLRMLAAAHRILRPAGSVMILQPNFRLVPRRYFDFIDHRVILTDASLVEALEITGFTVAELRPRFLPFTSKSRMPRAPWLVSLYLRLRPAQWLLGGQTFARGVKAPPEAR